MFYCSGSNNSANAWLTLQYGEHDASLEDVEGAKLEVADPGPRRETSRSGPSQHESRKASLEDVEGANSKERIPVLEEERPNPVLLNTNLER